MIKFTLYEAKEMEIKKTKLFPYVNAKFLAKKYTNCRRKRLKNILHVDGYILMYHKLILLSMKWAKKKTLSRKTMKKCKIEVKTN